MNTISKNRKISPKFLFQPILCITAQKADFYLKIVLNVSKSTENCGFVHFYLRTS